MESRARDFWKSRPISDTQLKMTRKNNKRKENSPKGGISKDLRHDELDGDIDDDIDWNEVGSKPHKSSKPDVSVIEQLNQATEDRVSERMSTTTRSNTAVSVIDLLNERASVKGSVAGGSQAQVSISTAKPDNMGEQTLFKTPKPEGSMRDVIIIEIQKINGEMFHGTITYDEASDDIFRGCLGFEDCMLHGVKFAYSNYPVVRYKLKDQIDIDELYNREHFELRRQVKTGSLIRTDILSCKIRGVRNPRARFKNVMNDPDQDHDPNLRWVTVEGCDYSLEEDEILVWLRMYGEVFGKLREDIHQHPGSDTNVAIVGNGNYSVKMRLDVPIPHMLPMFGKKISIYFKGEQKLCTNCFGTHHRRNCQSRKVQWIDYIKKFMRNNPNVPEEHYGKWTEIIANESSQTNNMQYEPHQQQTQYMQPQKTQQQKMQQQPLPEKNQKMRKEETNHPCVVTGTSGTQKWKPTQEINLANQARRKTLPSSQKHQTLKQGKADQVTQIYDDLENGNRLAELVDLGLTVDAARDLLKQESEIDAVNQLLEEKREKNGTKDKGNINSAFNDKNERQYQRGNAKEITHRAVYEQQRRQGQVRQDMQNNQYKC